ncbi:uncharacterized protein LOC107850823 isoform X1 [Capsicum annuum]|uniref:uncharacterized protein LOC107850823 isoform X1 n=1 Tax=Capsicum annuum TaxID=4072 RepID=UPI0007BFA279|nr:uncharacterized protein LOC107850823 isoform X1 [Capsicum annuum]
MATGRSSPSSVADDDNNDNNNSNNNNSSNNNNNAGRFHSIRDRFRFKRNSQKPSLPTPLSSPSSLSSSSPDRHWKTSSSRPHHFHHHYNHNRSYNRKLISFCFRGKWLYLCVFLVIFVFAIASMVLQSSIMSVFRQSENARWRSVRDDLKLGSSLEFVQPPRFQYGNGLDLVRNQPRIGVRPPRIALVLGNMKKDPLSLMLSTLVKNLRGLGYMIKIYAVEDGVARSMWEEIGGRVLILTAERYNLIDWSIFDGVIADSLEDKNAISSLMQEPFCSVPLVWIIQQDTLASRLPFYESMSWEHLISHWRDAFRRASVIVFPDYILPMLYSGLDTGNFFVIPGSPKDNWAADSYSRRHSKSQSRKTYGFGKDDLLVLVFGSSILYNELSWDYALSFRDIEPLLLNFAGRSDVEERLKFVFMSGNSSDGYKEALQDITTRLGLHEGSLSHYDMKGDVNGIILMADIVLYFSPQYEQEFPPILIRAMSFGIPIVAPDLPVIKKYIVDEVHGIIFSQHNSNELVQDFSRLISNGKLTRFAHTIASSGRLLSKNMFAMECVTGYAKLLENVITFPSDVILPGDTSQLKHGSWEWAYFQKDVEDSKGIEDLQMKDVDPINSGVVYDLELEMIGFVPLMNVSTDDPEALKGEDFPNELDWDILNQMERSEEVNRLEMEELEERMEKGIGKWDDIYRNARKAEKLRFESNERDEGELERTGQPLCIYEVYDGTGAWPFLHHGSLYRGLSLSTKARRLQSDDVDAVLRLNLLHDTYFQNILCEMGGMFSIANHLDNIHKRPWIGFQSWQATGRKVSLSKKAELALEEIIQGKTKGDVIYYWAHLDVDGGFTGSNDALTFWSMCDILNGGNCRNAFQDAFRIMYGLPSHIEALPPMPDDGGRWSALHSWVMPTSSFMEFVMFSRMFVDALDNLHVNSSNRTHCILAISTLEKQHCYCRVLELLVNVWAYHSAQQMVYLNPHSGVTEEQHSVEQRRGYMWAKYFNMTLLKSMDEDLAEAADDNYYPYETWLWPLTGEVYWEGIYEREREERYRQKMDKKRRTKEKLLDRMKHGYKQRSLG